MVLQTAAPDSEPSRQLLVEAASDAIVSVDLSSGTILAGNRRLETLTGYALESLLGSHVDALKPRNRPPHDRPFGPDILVQPGLYEDVCLGRADGFTVWASVRVAHVDQDGRTVAICVIRDESERRMLERELITKHLALLNAHEELERKVTELRCMRDALEERHREITELSSRIASISRRAMLAEVVAEVAHNMNNPLGALTSSLRMMGRLGAQLEDPALRERHSKLLERCDAACHRMTHVLEELRRACRSGTVPAVTQNVDLNEEIRSAVALVAHQAPPGVEIVLDLQGKLCVQANSDDVHHVVLNLLDNALYAVGEQGRIVIGSRGIDGGAELIVSDSGPGIPDDTLDSIFEPFFTTKLGRGTGLGLSMVRRTAMRHGAAVSVEPRGPLGGASFRIAWRGCDR